MLYYPENQGLYSARNEHDACGIGAVVNINGRPDHSIIEYSKELLLNLHHRGAAGADETTGDGAGILFQIPHEFFAAEADRLGFQIAEAAAVRGGDGIWSEGSAHCANNVKAYLKPRLPITE